MVLLLLLREGALNDPPERPPETAKAGNTHMNEIIRAHTKEARRRLMRRA